MGLEREREGGLTEKGQLELQLELLGPYKTKHELTELKAQQDPHCPWFLIGVTYPAVLQSTDVGISTFASF